MAPRLLPTRRSAPRRSTPLTAMVVGLTFGLVVSLVASVRPSPVSAATGVDTTTADFATIAALDELTGDHARLFRLYWAAFGRQPDPEGAVYWIGEHDRCLGLDRIAALFVDSAEFQNRYGPLDNDGFVRQLYRNVLQREAEAEGLRYWRGLLDRDELDRGGVLLNVSLSSELVRRRPYPSDGVAARGCQVTRERSTVRRIHAIVDPSSTPVATVAGLTLMAPAATVERLGFHQSSHPGALAMAAPDDPVVRTTTMASRNRGTARTGAADIAVEPTTAILAPLSGRVARAGNYTLYCRYQDGFVVINPDGRPDLEVKVLHVQGVSVRAGDRVEAGDVVASNATLFPFDSQIDALTGEPSWPHVHVEVVDPSVPRPPSSGRGC